MHKFSDQTGYEVEAWLIDKWERKLEGDYGALAGGHSISPCQGLSDKGPPVLYMKHARLDSEARQLVRDLSLLTAF